MNAIVNDTGEFLKLCADMETEEALSPAQIDHAARPLVREVGEAKSGILGPRCDVPEFLRQSPAVTDLLVVDERIPLVPLFAVLANAGYTVVNRRDGKLVVTLRPNDFR